MMTYPLKIFDDFICPTYYRNVRDFLCGTTCDWFYQDDLSQTKSGKVEEFGFGRNIFELPDGATTPNNIFFLPLLYQIQDAVNGSSIVRARGDLTTLKHSFQHSPHVDIVDITQPYITTIFYVNDSDGDTVVFNETNRSYEYTEQKRIQPKANRLLTFDGKFYHTGSSPTKHSIRVVINSNYTQ